MKSHNIIYKNNKFYDTSSNKRVYPKDGELFLIAGDNYSFGDCDPLNIAHEPSGILNNEKKLEEVKKIKHLKTYKLALAAGSNIFFEISINKTKNADEQLNYRFRLSICQNFEKSQAISNMGLLRHIKQIALAHGG